MSQAEVATRLPPGGDPGSATIREYVESQAAAVLGVPTGAFRLDPGLQASLFRELSRTVEVETPLRDLWGNWEFPYAESNLRGELYVPWLDRPLAELRRSLAAAHPEPALEPLWPEDRPFALCLTHDMDVVTLDPPLSHSARQLARDARLLLDRGSGGPAEMALRNVARALVRISTLRGLRPPSRRSYDEWLALEGRLGFHSTFFFFPERVSAPHVYDCLYRYDDEMPWQGRRLRVRDAMNEIARAGCEVGLHGSYHSALRPGMLAEQKREVEAAVGRAVTSTRQHWLHYDARVTPRLQADAGLLADSTQGFNRNVGFRAGTCFPYRCWDLERGAALPVLEVPQHVMDGALFTPNALEYDQDHAVRHCLRLMDEVQAVGGCLTLSWHPNTLELPAYWDTYRALLEEAGRRRAWGCSVAELHAWWTARAERLRAAAAPA